MGLIRERGRKKPGETAGVYHGNKILKSTKITIFHNQSKLLLNIGKDEVDPSASVSGPVCGRGPDKTLECWCIKPWCTVFVCVTSQCWCIKPWCDGGAMHCWVLMHKTANAKESHCISQWSCITMLMHKSGIQLSSRYWAINIDAMKLQLLHSTVFISIASKYWHVWNLWCNRAAVTS